ncbi:hypothetical protein N0S44_000227 [Escherichia coli]|nr:hypothetical protein [Escherichia coli]EJR1979077.1 hypothetical protein [Escherichia coli]
MFSEYEEAIKRNLEDYKFQFYIWDELMRLCLQWMENKETPEQRTVILNILLHKDLSSINVEVSTYVGEDYNPYVSYTSPVPTTEEEYFQMSTVQEPLFTYEFYKYLIGEFIKMRIKS